jgi:hypothetical protein
MNLQSNVISRFSLAKSLEVRDSNSENIRILGFASFKSKGNNIGGLVQNPEILFILLITVVLWLFLCEIHMGLTKSV